MIRNFLKDDQGQDLIEYALMACFVAVAAGALMPGVAAHIRAILMAGTNPPAFMSLVGGTTIRIICAGLAVVFLVAVVLRRRQNDDM